jgi:hypothetical protein
MHRGRVRHSADLRTVTIAAPRRTRKVIGRTMAVATEAGRYRSAVDDQNP